MKKTSLIAVLSIFCLQGYTQTVSSSQMNNPEKKATFLIRDLQTKISLTDKQKDSLFFIFRSQIKMADSIKRLGNNPIARQNLQSKFIASKTAIDSLLTNDQRLLFYQWKSNRKSVKSKI